MIYYKNNLIGEIKVAETNNEGTVLTLGSLPENKLICGVTENSVKSYTKPSYNQDLVYTDTANQLGTYLSVIPSKDKYLSTNEYGVLNWRNL